MISPHELDKVTVTHYGSIEDARRELGYEPVKSATEALLECLPYSRDLLEKIREERKSK